jgi:hydrogenase-4 component B
MRFASWMGLPAVLLLRLLVIAATLILARERVGRRVAFVGSAIASAMTVLTAIAVLGSQTAVHGALLVHAASQFSLTYRIDGIAAWFLLTLGIIGMVIAIFSLGYIGHGHWRARAIFIGVAFNILLGAVELVFAADDAITFLFGWETMTLATAALVVTEHENLVTRRAALLYLVMSHVATGCLMAGFFVLAAASRSVAFSSLLSGDVVHGPVRDVLFGLFVIGFGVKAGIIPLHIWLPEAHPAAPSSISALMSGVLLKAGIYGIVRVGAFGLGVPRLSWGVIVVALGGVSAVVGVLYALMQHDIKRLLAYHSIENIGIILLGLGAGMMAQASGQPELAWIGVAASLYHVLNHAVFKSLLFLSAGNIVMTTGNRALEQFGGLLRRMPLTGLLFLIGAMAISGLPPLNGFASEWLTFQAFLYGFRGSADQPMHLLFPVAGALLALTTALAAACFVKAFGISFLALPRSPAAADAREAPAVMLIPQALLAVLCFALGLWPGMVLRVVGRVLQIPPRLQLPADATWGAFGMTSGGGAFDHIVPLVFAAALVGGVALAGVLAWRGSLRTRRVPTWGCGGELSAQTEYTATAFSKPLMMIFRAVYRPTRHVDSLPEVSPYFPREVRYRAEIEPTFERFIYGPLLRVVLRVANGLKGVQAGSLHAYLAYVMALVVWLMLLVWWRG